jgi:hypothetical protein
MRYVKAMATLITVITLFSLPALAQRNRRPGRDAGEMRRATIEVRKSGDSLSFDGCTDGPRCRSTPVDASPTNVIHTLVWDVRIANERVQSVDVDFKNNVTPCFSRGARLRDARNVRANRGHVVCRIKVNGWSEDTDESRVTALDRDEYSYTITVVTDAKPDGYKVDPIVIVRRGG